MWWLVFFVALIKSSTSFSLRFVIRPTSSLTRSSKSIHYMNNDNNEYYASSIVEEAYELTIEKQMQAMNIIFEETSSQNSVMAAAAFCIDQFFFTKRISNDTFINDSSYFFRSSEKTFFGISDAQKKQAFKSKKCNFFFSNPTSRF